MPKYLIALENHDGGRASSLEPLLSQWDAQHLLDSIWLADIDGDARAIVQQLQRALSQDAAFAVIEIRKGTDWAVSQNVYGLGYEWLKGRL